MDSWIIAMMLIASVTLGGFGLWGLLWGLKTGQFEDKNRFLDGALNDGEDALKDAIMLEKRKKEILKKKKESDYRPPD